MVFLDMDLDTGTPVGKMIAVILVSVAEFERARGIERTREVIAAKRRRGAPLGQPPYGYKLERISHKKGEMKKSLAPDPYTRDVGAKILEWFDKGWSYDDIYFHLLRNRILTRLQKEWSRTAITRACEGERRLQALEAEGGTWQEILLRIMQPVEPDGGVKSESNLESQSGGGYAASIGAAQQLTCREEKTEEEKSAATTTQAEPPG